MIQMDLMRLKLIDFKWLKRIEIDLIWLQLIEFWFDSNGFDVIKVDWFQVITIDLVWLQFISNDTNVFDMIKMD